MVEPVIIGDAELWCGDCREILPGMGRVDALITDPPYGIGLKEKVNKHTVRHVSYGELFTDSNEEHIDVRDGVKLALSAAGRAAIFTGKRHLQEYPPASDIGGVFQPNGAGRGPWGWTCFHPVLFYGKAPKRNSGSYPTSREICHPGNHMTGEENGHPCPKPIAYMTWLVGLASTDGETVLDPFMGSGTTGVACMQLGRKFIGIEIEPRWFDIACRRIEEAQRQYRLPLECVS